MPLFSRRPVAQPAGYHTRPSPMTRLKRMFAPRRTRHTHTTTAGRGAAANPVATVEREGRRAKRFFTRRARGATGATTTAAPRRRRGLFSSRRRHHGAGVAVPVGGGGNTGAYPHRRSPLASLTALFSRKRAPRHHAGGVGAATGGRANYVA